MPRCGRSRGAEHRAAERRVHPGAVTVVVWGNVEALSTAMYEIVPGFVLSLLVSVVVSRLTYRVRPEIEREFDEALEMLEPAGAGPAAGG